MAAVAAVLYYDRERNAFRPVAVIRRESREPGVRRSGVNLRGARFAGDADRDAFHGAAAHGDIEMARLLLKHGADPKLKTEDGKNAADVAEKYGQPAFVEWFRANIK